MNINNEYTELLKTMALLSRLFSDNKIPYLYYRNAENLFCYALNARNLGRDDTAFDALIEKDSHKTAVGLKTFICQKNNKLEKVAEFNQLSSTLIHPDLYETARRISNARNERILFAKRLYNIENAIYHIVSRRENELRLFEENYDLIDVENINSVKRTNGGLVFSDNKNSYSYNFSKSTLFKRFIVPKNCVSIPVEIISEPYELLLSLREHLEKEQKVQNQYQTIILPLYSTRTNDVPECSGLNQWNANGRKRDLNEVYIPVPRYIHNNYPDFFPSQEQPFNLITPDGTVLNVKICQQGGKALMSNPNSALADWLLRQLLNLKEGELATMLRLELMDCDSVLITKINETEFKIDKAKFGAYREFSSQ